MEEITTEMTEQKHVLKISQLRARLQKEEALLRQKYRKDRNGERISFGILVEELYKNATRDEQIQWKEKAHQYLKDRALTRAMAGFERLEHSVKK